MVCRNLSALSAIQRDIIEKHIEKHKWYNGIENKEEAIQDFIDKFAWIIREMYCGYICGQRFRCKDAQKYIPEDQKEIVSFVQRMIG